MYIGLDITLHKMRSSEDEPVKKGIKFNDHIIPHCDKSIL